nr:hypothetical protein Iba_scaffold31477CG0010 [Ipomoea batatas]GMC85698.1 hypothetical protein Iba_chr04dCG3860 [Ipomoea batatas]GME11595.1 hypothetical protein Iba_scaffold11972CG0020 [Ipomoea batatas]
MAFLFPLILQPARSPMIKHQHFEQQYRVQNFELQNYPGLLVINYDFQHIIQHKLPFHNHCRHPTNHL